MKITNAFKLSILLSLMFCVFVSCEDDDNGDDQNNQDDALVGIYEFGTASLASDFVVGEDVLLEAGTDFSAAFRSLLDQAALCNSVDNDQLELRNTGEIFFVCKGEDNEFQNGTWAVNDARTELTLNLTIQGNAAQLKLTNLNESGGNISGTVENLPLPPEIFLLFQLQLPDAPAYLVDLNISFNRV